MQSGKDNGGDTIKFEPFTPPSTAELDTLIPAYKFLEFIECGGMGAVYKAVQKSLNRTVAVKLLPQVHRHRATFSDRFKREAHALAALNHPHIVAVHDFGETPDGQMYYAMEFVPGMDLQQLLRRAPPGPKQIFKIITQVCEALQFAHERGIVHRDIKPANILIDERGNVKVADFGLVKVIGPQADNYTASGATLGTPDYIAPEALDHGGKIDHRADIYSLGVMIYELLTGHVPKGTWEPPSACSGSDKRIDVVVSTAMQNNPEKRYQHVSDMSQVLEKLLVNSDHWKNYRRSVKSDVRSPGDTPAEAEMDSVTLRLKRGGAPRQRPLLWLAGLLVLGTGLFAVWQVLRPEAAGQPPETGPSATPAAAVPAIAPEQAKLARWVVERGGFVNVLAAGSTERRMGEEADIHAVVELPVVPYTVWRVCFSEAPIADAVVFEELVELIQEADTVANLNLRGTTVPAEALESLALMPTLTNLDLTASPAVTLAAVPHIAACRQLKLLRIGGSSPAWDGAITDELRVLLPDCLIHDDQ